MATAQAGTTPIMVGVATPTMATYSPVPYSATTLPAVATRVSTVTPVRPASTPRARAALVSARASVSPFAYLVTRRLGGSGHRCAGPTAAQPVQGGWRLRGWSGVVAALIVVCGLATLAGPAHAGLPVHGPTCAGAASRSSVSFAQYRCVRTTARITVIVSGSRRPSSRPAPPRSPAPTPPPAPPSPSSPSSPSSSSSAPGRTRVPATASGSASTTVPPPTPASMGAPVPAVGGSWWGDISAHVRDAINAWLAGLVAGALQPAVATAGALMDPARLTATGALYQLWADSRAIANTIFVLLVLVGGVIVLGFETMQSRYALKQIAPRLVGGWLAANLSWSLITTTTKLAAAVAVAVAGANLHPSDILTQLVTAITSDGPTFMVILAGVVVVLALVLAFTLIVIIALLLGLTVAAPLALCLHALPQTEAIAWWWWRVFAAALAVPTLHALLLAVLARVLLTPGGLAVGVFGLPSGSLAPGSLLTVLVVIALLYLMIKIPGWVLHSATGGGRRGGLLRGVLSSAVFTAGLAAMGVPLPAVAGRGAGLLGSRAGLAAFGLRATIRRPTPRTTARTASGVRSGSARVARTPTPPSTRGARAASSGPSVSHAGHGGGPAAGQDPYARVRVGRGGQLLLPLDELTPQRGSPTGTPPARQRPSGTPAAATTRGGAPGSRGRARAGRQLRLPLGAEWPEQRPVLGRDGQYRLPIHPPRTARRSPARAPSPGPTAHPLRPGPGQLPLPLIWPTPPRRRPRTQPPR